MLSDPSDEMWRRGWREGQSFGSTGWPLGAPMHHAHRFLRRGGSARLAPQARSELHPSSSGRKKTSRGIAAGEPARHLAKRPTRTLRVSRETARNAGRDRYQAATADTAAYGHGPRPKQTKLAQLSPPPAPAEAKPALCRSPEQIAGRG